MEFLKSVVVSSRESVRIEFGSWRRSLWIELSAEWRKTEEFVRRTRIIYVVIFEMNCSASSIPVFDFKIKVS